MSQVPIRIKQEPAGDEESRLLEAELDVLFDDDDDEEEEEGVEKAPAKRPLTEEEKAELAVRRRRALQKQRASRMKTKKRLVCDCYLDQAIKRARVHVKATEEACQQVNQLLPVSSDMYNKGVNERINQANLRLRKLEKLCRTMGIQLGELRRIADRGVARGNELAMKIACVTAKRSDINVVNHHGKPLKVTQYDAFRSLDYRAKPRNRKQQQQI